MKFSITHKASYITKVFSLEDKEGNEYTVRFIENVSYTAIEVESAEEGLLDEEDPRYDELVEICDAENV